MLSFAKKNYCIENGIVQDSDIFFLTSCTDVNRIGMVMICHVCLKIVDILIFYIHI